MEDLLEFCVDFSLKNGASYAEARYVNTQLESYILKNGTLEVSGFSRDFGIGVRVLVDETLGFFAISDLRKEKLKEGVKKAIKLARASARLKKRVNFSKEKILRKKWQVRPRIKFEDIATEDKINLLSELDKGIRFKEIVTRILNLSLSQEERYYINSEGTRIYSTQPRILFAYNLLASRGRDSEQRYFHMGESGGWECLKKWKLEARVEEEARILIKILKSGKKLKKGIYDVILSPELVGTAVHECCGHPAEADRILGREGAQAGESYLSKEWLGRRIGSKVVNVVDDPKVPHSYGFYEYDDEGVKAERRFLIKEGVISDFLHNRETAFDFNRNSNASARASNFSREPIIRMSTTFMLPGDYRFEELIEDIKKGVYIKSFTEWNIDDKRWNQRYVGSEAYLIERGELKGLVRRPVLEITTKGFLSSIDACGKDLSFFAGICGKGEPMQGVPVWMGGPSIRLRNIRMV